MFSIIMPFLIYWLVMFVLSYMAVEIGQDQLYDAVTPMAGLKVAGGSFLLAVMLTKFHPRFESMFTDNIASTAFQALVWIGVFILIYQFHPWHGLAIALPIMLLCSGFASMGVDSVMTKQPKQAPPRRSARPSRFESRRPPHPPHLSPQTRRSETGPVGFDFKGQAALDRNSAPASSSAPSPGVTAVGDAGSFGLVRGGSDCRTAHWGWIPARE